MSERAPVQQHPSYENYSATAASYDLTRVPVGIDVIVHGLEKRGARAAEARLLDAGCGTGSYLAALRERVRELAGLELNPEMLARAREKLGQATNVRLHAGSVLEMPFDDGHFDAVLFNQVLHHLDDGAGTGDGAWPNLRRALSEARRVLRHGGLLSINTCTHEQIQQAYWYVALIPEAAERLTRRYASVDELSRLLDGLGFGPVETIAPGNITPESATFGGARYLDPAGPFDPSWRNGDSIWSLVTETELQAALSTLKALHDAGTVADFVSEHDQVRRRIGQAVFVLARRG